MWFIYYSICLFFIYILLCVTGISKDSGLGWGIASVFAKFPHSVVFDTFEKCCRSITFLMLRMHHSPVKFDNVHAPIMTISSKVRWLSSVMQGGLLLFVSSYFEYIRISNFLKSKEASFCRIGEWVDLPSFYRLFY